MDDLLFDEMTKGIEEQVMGAIMLMLVHEILLLQKRETPKEDTAKALEKQAEEISKDTAVKIVALMRAANKMNGLVKS